MKFEKIQIEPTTRCNLACVYCLRDKFGEVDVDLEIVEKIAGSAKKYVVYGYGEPLLHPKLEKILDLLDGEIILSTNGMFDFFEVAGIVDKLAVSFDLTGLRRGLRIAEVEKRLKYVDRGMLQVVVTRGNVEAMPKIIEIAAENDMGVFVTNVVAKNSLIYKERLYFEGSKRNVELVRGLGEDIIVKAIHDYSRGYGEYADIYKQIIKDVYGNGYSINLISIFESKEAIEWASKAERYFEELKEMAKDLGVDLEIPAFFADAKSRECPYKNSIFVRADGLVSSCMPFAYTHYEFVNSHFKKIEAYTPADLKIHNIDDVYELISKFEMIRKDLENFPWCADCPYVIGCWFAEKNIDCYTNSPSCSECLYSCKIARCLL